MECQSVIDIPRTSVKSSQIVAIGYDQNRSKLHIEFKGGSVYEYDDVTPELHKSFMEAESHGKFFGRNIKGVHIYRKLPKA